MSHGGADIHNVGPLEGAVGPSGASSTQSVVPLSYFLAVDSASSVPLPGFDLGFRPPEFPVSLIGAIREEWNRAKSKLEYAARIREKDRFKSVLSQHLLPLLKAFPNAPHLNFVIGYIQKEIGQPDRAIESFQRAIATSDNESYWLAIASTAWLLKDSALTCYYLHRHFMKVTPSEQKPEWWVYLRLIKEHSDFRGLRRILISAASMVVPSESRVALINAVTYALTICGRLEEAEAANLTAKTHEVSLSALVPFFSTLPQTPSRELQKVEGMPESTVHDSLAMENALEANAPGKIVSFGQQGSGLIEKSDGQTVFFHISAVIDPVLKEHLSTESGRSGETHVIFDEVAKPSHKYNTAIRIQQFLNVNDLIIRAKERGSEGEYAQALYYVRLALRISPRNVEGKQLEVQLLEKTTVASLPPAASSYVRAKWAQIHDKNMTAAEDLFRKAIDQSDHFENAVQELALLLNQQQRADEAIHLLQTYRSRTLSPDRIDVLLATLYQSSGHYDAAVEILTEVSQRVAPSRRVAVLLRLAFCQYKAEHYKEATNTIDHVLSLDQENSVALRMGEALNIAEASGRFDEADEIFAPYGELSDFSSSLSIFILGFLKGYSPPNMKIANLESSPISEKTAEELEQAARTLDNSRPRDKAAYYLAAAMVLAKLTPSEGSARLIDCLRRFLGHAADAAKAERKHADVARALYAESLSFASASAESVSGLTKYLMSLHPPEAELSLAASPREVLNRVFKSDVSKHFIFDCLMYLSVRSRWATNELIREMGHRKDLFKELSDYLGNSDFSTVQKLGAAWEAKRQQFAKDLESINARLGTFSRFRFTSAALESLVRQLNGIESRLLFDLDRQRIRRLAEIAEWAHKFSTAGEFEEKELNYQLATTQLDALKTDIIDNPTKQSCESFIPLVEHIRSLIEETFADVSRNSRPQLDVKLTVRDYVPNESHEIRLQVGVANRPSSSPATSLEISVGPPDSLYFEGATCISSNGGVLRGGQTADIEVRLTVTAIGQKQSAFPVRIGVRFLDRDGLLIDIPPAEYTVRLYTQADFREIVNVYAPYAEGGPVDNPGMFFGRSELIDAIASSLETGTGTKYIVLYGQKRAGKSSVLEHLKRRLAQGPLLPVSFSIHDIVSELTEERFLFHIMHEIARAIDERIDAGAPAIPFQLPTRKEFRSSRALSFHAALSDFLRACKHTPGWAGVRIVLLIDEFTDIFNQIKKSRIAREFMKTWKAFLEKRYFSAVLVGQDTMPAFKAEFPNEFGVTQDERITYLAEDDAREMIERPISAARLAGRAIPRILELTACSPFYTMMLCKRLVEYINKQKALVVTEADIEHLKVDMISGHNSITLDKFDPLISAGEGLVDTDIDSAESLAICSSIARNSQLGWCPESMINGGQSTSRSAILLDLAQRGVVEKNAGQYRIRVGLFAEWLRCND